MKHIVETLTPVDGRQKEIPFADFGAPGSEEIAGLAKHNTLYSVYRRMLSELQNQTVWTDNEVAAALDMDPGHFSRVMHGNASFNWGQEFHFMALCRTADPIFWRCLQTGFDHSSLRPVETLAEQRLRQSQEENEKLKAELAAVSKALRGEY